jgi:hypothetical protein
MRRLVLLLLLALVAASALPPAGGRYVTQGRSPWEGGYSLNPQMYCAVVYDTAGEEDCSVSGQVRSVDIVRVRIVGAGSAHVAIVDMTGNALGLPEQRAVVDCDATCIVDIPGPAWTDPDWVMWVDTASPGNSVVQVSVETRTQIVDDRDV